MFSVKSRPLGIRTTLTLWTSLVLAVSLAAGFMWVDLGLRAVLAARNDAFLERKAAELTAAARETRSGDAEGLDAEIRREVAAYEAEGLVVIIRSRERWSSLRHRRGRSRFQASAKLASGERPETIVVAGGTSYRVLKAPWGRRATGSNWGCRSRRRN